jgi:D-sedoheptulose 7-phosphate isomerase
MEKIWLQGGTIFTFGNGACAALASHMACDLGKGTSMDLGTGPNEISSGRLRVICLNDCIPLMTALANDVEYNDIFLEQLKNLLTKNDMVFGLSGSGGSQTVLRAMQYANKVGALTVCMTGAQPKSEMIARLSKICLQAPSSLMEQIEDIHIIFHHAIALALRARIQTHHSDTAGE